MGAAHAVCGGVGEEDAGWAVRLRVGQILTAPDYVIDVIDGPRKTALRGDDGEIRRFATRAEAQAELEAMMDEATTWNEHLG